MKDIFAALHIIRTPAILTVAAAYFLSLPEQTIETYRAIAQDVTIKVGVVDKYRELLFSSLGLLGMGVAACFVTHRLTTRVPNTVTSRAGRCLLACAPVALFIIIALSAAVGVYRAQTPPLNNAGKEAVTWAWRESVNLDENTPPVILEVLRETISGVFVTNTSLLWAAASIILVAAIVAVVLSVLQARLPPSTDYRREFLPTAASWLILLLFFAAVAAVLLWPISLTKSPRRSARAVNFCAPLAAEPRGAHILTSLTPPTLTQRTRPRHRAAAG